MLLRRLLLYQTVVNVFLSRSHDYVIARLVLSSARSICIQRISFS